MPNFSPQQIIDELVEAASEEGVHEAARHALAGLDAVNEEAIQKRKLTLACRDGCSLCCWLRVDGFAHEVLLIAHHIRSHFDAQQIADLEDRLTTHVGTLQSLTPFAHATTNVCCPLLVEGRCSVYEVRPQACRRHHSQDFTACQFTYDHPTDLEAPAAHDRELFRALTEAMQGNIGAYASLGFDHTIYELGTALNEALSDAASWDRWCRRETAFLNASVTPPE